MSDNMWARIGGSSQVSTLLDDLFALIGDDPELVGYFAGVDVAIAIKPHFAKLLATLLGGPGSYDPAQLREAHMRLGITPDHFDRVIVHFIHALSAHRVPLDIKMHLAKAAMGTKSLVVAQPKPAEGVRISLYADGREVEVLCRNATPEIAHDVVARLQPFVRDGITVTYTDGREDRWSTRTNGG